MVRRLATISSQFIPLLLVALTAGCGGGSSNVSVGNTGNPTPAGPAVVGTVLMPNGQVAQIDSSLMDRVIALAVDKAEALIATNVGPVGRNIQVTLSLLGRNGQPQNYGATVTALTNDHGQYEINLPPHTDANTCRYVVSVGSGDTLTRAFVFSNSQAVDIDFASEAVVRMILAQVANGVDLCTFSTGTIAATDQAIRSLPGVLTGNSVNAINLSAARTATAAPAVQETLGLAAPSTPTPTPETPTSTPKPPTPTQPPSPSNTPTTPAPTHTKTTVPSATPTTPVPPTNTNTPLIATNTPNSPTATPQTPTATPQSPTATPQTPTATAPATDTPTNTPRTPTSTPATPTNTPVSPTNTPIPPTPTNTPPIATATPIPGVPLITIGTASGAPGTSVNVPISLTKNGPQIVTIAPLVFTFDSSVLTFNSCAADVAGESVDAVSPTAGHVSFVMHSANNAVIPEGQIAHCTFTINNGAAIGPSALTFSAAGTADANLIDYTATGNSGSVTVITPSGPAIAIGSTSGAPGASVNVPISLTKNGINIVAIAPLVFTFDSSVLTFNSCASDVAGESVDAVSPTSGHVSLVMHSANNAVIPDGQIAHCTFTINNGAAIGPSALTFSAAGTADANLIDYTASGSSGSVTVSIPTNPAVSIGSAAGAPGASVSIAISLTKNGPNIVTIAPLLFTFDGTVLTFNSCASDVAGESVDAVSPTAGHVSFVMHSANNAVIPNGQIAHCTFTINNGAAPGGSPLTFAAAGMADTNQTDYTATGSSGSVTVNAVSGPVITIGTGSGAPGTSVSIPISLTKNGPNIVTIAPLVFSFDPNVLTPNGSNPCATDAGGEVVDAVSPAAGHISLVMHSSTLAVIPNGQIAHCTFTINGGAVAGPSTLTFIAAGMADAGQTDFSATGSSGSITVTAPTGPVITLGTASGAANAQVDVAISLNQNGANVVTIAPLVFTFDSNVLTVANPNNACTSDAAAEQVDAVSPTAGHVSLVMHSGSNAVIPNNQIAHCTFTINNGAATGPSPLTFVAAGMADAAQNDISATGISGSVTVQ